MGNETERTAYGNEPPTRENGPTGNPAGTGLRSRIGSRFAPNPSRDAAPEGYENPNSGARIQTGEQTVGRSGARPRPSDAAPERASATDAASAAKSTLSPLRLTSRLVGMSLGIDATMTPDEQRDIADPLARIYQRNPRVAAAVNRYTDPVMLLTAVAVYVARIWLTWQQTQLVRAQTALVAQQQRAQQQGRPQPVTPLRPVTPAPSAPVAGEAKPEGPSFAELDSIMSMGR